MGFGSGFDNGANVSERMNARYPKPKKTVFAGDMAIHVWAQRSQAWGRNSKATSFFEGDTLYSYGYHYVAAKFVEGRKGVVALFNQRKWGVTTDAQVWAAYHAVKDTTPRFFVKNPVASYKEAHIENLRDMLASYNAAIERSKNTRCKAATRLSALNSADALVAKMLEYRGAFLTAKDFKVPAKSKARVAAEVAAKFGSALEDYKRASGLHTRRINYSRGYRSGQKATIADMFRHKRDMFKAYILMRRAIADGAQGELPKLDVAKHVAMMRAYRKAMKRQVWTRYESFEYAAQNALRKIFEQRDWPNQVIRDAELWIDRKASDSYMLNVSVRSLESVPKYCEDHKLEIPAKWQATLDAARACLELQRKRDAEKEAANAAKEKETIDKWLANDPTVRASYDWPVMLRLKGEKVETTKGATFPADDARKAWPVIKACYDAGRTWKRNGERLPMGVFQVDRIEGDGTIIAGCHTIRRNEVERFANQLGLQ